MNSESLSNLESLERNSQMDLKEQRQRLVIVERSQNSFTQEEWARYRAMAERFRGQIKALFPGMGS